MWVLIQVRSGERETGCARNVMKAGIFTNSFYGAIAYFLSDWDAMRSCDVMKVGSYQLKELHLHQIVSRRKVFY